MPNGKVLTDNDLASMKEGLAQLDDADSLIEQARRAGIDVDEFSRNSKSARDQLLRLKQAFFPGE